MNMALTLRLIYLMCFIFCIHVNFFSEYIVESSTTCGNMFQYQREGNDWFGLVQIQSLHLKKPIKLEVKLSLPGKLPSLDAGSIELYRSNEDALQEIRNNLPVRFRVRFPLQNPLPKVTQISVNGLVFCTDTPETNSIVTQIRLECILFTEPSNPQQLLYQRQSESEQPLNQPQRSNTSHVDGEICGRLHAKYNFNFLSASGETIKRGSWPWIVAIYVNDEYGSSFHCTGNLISAKTVVTAASCFQTPHRTYQPNDLILFLGRYNISNWMETGIKMYLVEQIVIHSDYMLKSDADIAAVILREKVEFTEYIRPICLWEQSDASTNIVGQYGTVIGWGRDSAGNFPISTPTKINMPVVSEVECLRSSDIYQNILSNRTFCAGSRNGRGLCYEDQGNGMTFNINNKWTLRGITSGLSIDPITNTFHSLEYFVFTDAGKFVDWIKSNMR